LVYEKGRLILATTRGDGFEGENVTAAALTIDSIPKTLKPSPSGHFANNLFDVHRYPDELTVRGEIYLEKHEFEVLNKDRQEKGLPLLANPRNAAAGALRHLDPEITRQRKLKFFAYGLAQPQSLGLPLYSQIMASLVDWGFAPEKSGFSQPRLNLEEVLKVFAELEKKRDSLPFEIDGLVITIEQLDLWVRLGATGRAPRYAVAAKFEPRPAETTVIGIEIQVGRTGALTPVAHLKPVSVGGVTVSKATLHNQDELKRKDVRLGDTVLVRRAGEVIPEVFSVLTHKRPHNSVPFQFPTHCPICHTEAVRPVAEAVWRCPNLWCAAQVKEGLIHFASKNALNIDGLGESLVERLLADKLIEIPTDIFRLKAEKLKALPR
ncbi:MAG: NAD-dependent DNA ligase LigA, partial [Candidatus Adiutrix sp.]